LKSDLFLVALDLSSDPVIVPDVSSSYETNSKSQSAMQKLIKSSKNII